MMFEDLYAADDFSAIRCPFWLKFHEMNGLGRGYVPFKFRDSIIMYTELAGKKPTRRGPKTVKKQPKIVILT